MRNGLLALGFLSVGIPQPLLETLHLDHPPAPNKEGITQPVEIGHRHRDPSLGQEPSALSFGTATDGSADMEIGVDSAGTGKDEASERR